MNAALRNLLSWPVVMSYGHRKYLTARAHLGANEHLQVRLMCAAVIVSRRSVRSLSAVLYAIYAHFAIIDSCTVARVLHVMRQESVKVTRRMQRTGSLLVGMPRRLTVST